MSDSVRMAIHFFCIFKWLYLPYFWVYLFPKFGVNRPKSKEDTVIWKCKKMMLRLWRFDMRMASWGLSARLKDVLCCLRRINWMLSEEWKLCAVVVKWSCVVWTVKCRVAMGVTCFFYLIWHWIALKSYASWSTAFIWLTYLIAQSLRFVYRIA